IPKQAKGGYDDLIPKQQKKGAYDDLIPKVSPDILAKVRSGNISAPVDPSIIARQKMPQPDRAVPSADMAMAPTAERPLTAQNEPSIAARQPQRPPTFAEAAKVTAKWLALKAAHGYDWARHLSPALASDAMTNMTDWTLNKAQDMATEVFRRAGADNPETMGHELVSLVVDLGMYRAGEGPPVEMGVGAAGEAAIEKALKTPAAVADTRPGRAAAAGEAAVGEALKTPEAPKLNEIPKSPEAVAAEKEAQVKNLTERMVKETATKPLDTRFTPQPVGAVSQTGQEAFKEGRRLY